MAEFFDKFEEIWAVIWDYIYKVLAYFKVEAPTDPFATTDAE